MRTKAHDTDICPRIRVHVFTGSITRSMKPLGRDPQKGVDNAMASMGHSTVTFRQSKSPSASTLWFVTLWSKNYAQQVQQRTKANNA